MEDVVGTIPDTKTEFHWTANVARKLAEHWKILLPVFVTVIAIITSAAVALYIHSDNKPKGVTPMNLPDVATALSLGASALGILKQLKDLLPDGPKKEEAMEKLERAENDLKIAQARVAKDLGYQLCYCSPVPAVMLQNKDDIWVCQSCGKEYNPVGIG